MLNIKVGLNNFEATSKDVVSSRIGAITNTIWRKPVELTIPEWMEAISKGKTSQLGVYEMFKSTPGMANPTDDFLSQQYVIAVDVDNQKFDANGNKVVLSKSEGYLSLAEAKLLPNVAFIWKTFNYSDNWERFRLAYILDQPVETKAQVKELYAYLFKQLNTPAVDFLTNSNRLFFGSNTYPIEINLNNTLKVEDILGSDWEDIEVVSQKTQNYLNKLKAKEAKNYKKASDGKPSSSVVEPKGAFINDLITSEMEGFNSSVINNSKLNNLPNWKLMALNNQQADFILKQRLGMFMQKVNDGNQFYNVFKRLPMNQILGIPTNPKTFLDILHKETNPSATIYQTDTGTWLYSVKSSHHKVFYDGRLSNIGDVFDVISTLKGKNFNTRKLVINYLVDLTNSTLENSEAIAQLKADLEDYIQETLQNEDAESLFPSYNKVVNGYGRNVYIASMLRQLADNVQVIETIDDDGEVHKQFKTLSYMSQLTLAKRLGLKDDQKRVQKLQMLMVYLGLIGKVDLKDVPTEIKNDLIKSSMAKGHALPNILQPLQPTTADMDVKAQELLDAHWTFSGATNDFYTDVIFRNAKDLDDAKAKATIFNPRAKKRISGAKSADDLKSKYSKIMVKAIIPFLTKKVNEEGYVIESDFLDQFREYYKQKEIAKAQLDPDYKPFLTPLQTKYWRSIRQGIFDDYDLVLLSTRNKINPAKGTDGIALKGDFEGLIDRYPKATQNPLIITKGNYIIGKGIDTLD